MKDFPVQRHNIYNLYWYFASERQKIFELRNCGVMPPWTDDRILQEYKFCNVYRASDRVSQYLIRDIAAKTDIDNDDQLFQIVAFRIFSKIETWETLKRILKHQPYINDLKDSTFTNALKRTDEINKGLYTGAFILCANKAFGYDKKYLNHAALLKKMFIDDKIADKLRNAISLKEIYELLHKYPLMGDFMSYQIAIDLNYSNQINFSENDFCKAGPGAMRGIAKVFEDTCDYTPEDIIQMMVKSQKDEFKRLGLNFNGLFGRPLHAIDCQGLFCEVDKYCRKAYPNLKSQRQRIKKRFIPSEKRIDLFFPPKWNINNIIKNSIKS